jgi:hypothetical protein
MSPGSDLEAWERSDRIIQRAADIWCDSSLLPFHYRDTNGNAMVSEVLLACGVLLDLGLSPRLCLPETYVVKGRLGLMASIQRTLATRGGYDLDLPEITAETANATIRRMGETSTHSVTVTMDMAKRAGWVSRNPNYGSMPEHMLAARACTWAISLYAPEVLHGVIIATGRPLVPELEPPDEEDEPEAVS